MPLQHRHGYAAALHRGLPASDSDQPRSSPHRSADARCSPAQIRQIRAGGLLLRSVQTLVSHVHLPVLLAGPGPSGGTGPSRRCRGCFPPSPVSPGSGCPQLHRPAATGPAEKVSHLPSNQTAPHGALNGGRKLTPFRRLKIGGLALDIYYEATAMPRRCGTPRSETALDDGLPDMW